MQNPDFGSGCVNGAILSGSLVIMDHTAWHDITWPGLKLWKVTAGTLNKQFQTVDKGRSSSLGMGQMLTTLHHKKLTFYELLCRSSSLDRGYALVAGFCECSDVCLGSIKDGEFID
jgi:hypothetical protein